MRHKALGLLLTLFSWLTPLAAPSGAAHAAVTWQLVETTVEKSNQPAVQVANGSVTDSRAGCRTQVSWSPPPAAMDSNGATITFNSQGQCPDSNNAMVEGGHRGYNGAAIVDVGGAPVTRSVARVFINGPGGPKNSGSASEQIRIRPPQNAGDGSTFEVWLGFSHRPGVRYRYRAQLAAGGPGNVTGGPGDARRLSATLECPSTISIGVLPSLNCHILIRGWRRNTATPVEVILPDAVDTYGNHANGIQIVGRGSEDIFRWEDPVYRWGLFVYACQSRNIGANCYNNVAAPGSKTVRMVVRQGDQVSEVVLIINALPNPRGGPGGGPVISGAQNAVNLPGADYMNFAVNDGRWETCQQACANDPRCRAFTFVKPGRQGPNAVCWLKNNVPPAVPDDCCISGAKTVAAEERRPPVTFRFNVEHAVNRMGSDYRNFAQNDARWETCQQACENDRNCQAFTFVRPGIQGPQAQCWLKDN